MFIKQVNFVHFNRRLVSANISFIFHKFQIILRGLKQLGREITIGPFEENDSIMVLNGSNQQTSQALQGLKKQKKFFFNFIYTSV